MSWKHRAAARATIDAFKEPKEASGRPAPRCPICLDGLRHSAHADTTSRGVRNRLRSTTHQTRVCACCGPVTTHARRH